MNEKDPVVVNYIKTLAQLESSGGKRLYGDDFGQGPTSAGLFHWNNEKKPLTGDMIPVNFKKDAKAFGFNPNDFSLSNQVKVAYARINHEKNVQGLSIEEIDAKWNGAKIINGRYVHVNPQRRSDLIATAKQLKQTGGTFNNVQNYLAPETASAAEQAPVQQEQQPQQTPRSLSGGIGDFLTNAFIKPAEQNVQNAMALSGGLGQKLGALARNAISGQGTVANPTMEQAIQKSANNLGNIGTLTETFTGNRINPANIATKQGLKQATGDVVEGALTYGTGGQFTGAKGLLKTPASKLLGEKLLSSVSQVGKPAIESISRGQIMKGGLVGAGQGLGLGVSDALQGDKDFTQAKTYGDVALNAIGGAVLGSGLAGVSKGVQKLSESAMRRAGNEAGAYANELKRKTGLKIDSKDAADVQALEQAKKNELSRIRQGFSELIGEENKKIGTVEKGLKKVSDVSDEAINKVIQSISNKKGKIKDIAHEGLGKINETKKVAAESVLNLGKALDKESLPIKPSDVYKKFKERLSLEVYSPEELKAIDKKFNEKYLSGSNIDKNGNLKFSVLDSARVKRNELYDKDPASIDGKISKMFGEVSKEFIDNLKDSKKLTSTQRKAVQEHFNARTEYKDNKDAQFLLEKLADSKVGAPKQLYNNFAAYLTAGATGNPFAFMGAHAGVEKLQKMAQEAGKKKLGTSVLASAMKKTENVGEKAKSVLSTMETEKLADKLKKAASNRVQKDVKTIEKAENKPLEVIQFGKTTTSKTKKKLSDGIKAAAKKTKLPTIDF